MAAKTWMAGPSPAMTVVHTATAVDTAAAVPTAAAEHTTGSLIPTSNLAHLLLQTARRFPERPAIIWRERVWTWAEFASRVQRAAGALAERGVRQGDRVLLHARNSNIVVETMFASWMLGAV